YRKGAAQAPQRIRTLSAVMPPVTEEGHLLTGLGVHDLGDLTAGSDIETGWTHVADRLAEVPADSVLTVLGGDHCTGVPTLVGARELAINPEAALKRVQERLAGSEVHVSFDIDSLDPAFAPATEIPSSGGLTSRQALEVLHSVAGVAKLVGLDLVELSPPFDNGNIRTLAPLKVTFESWGLASTGPGPADGAQHA